MVAGEGIPAGPATGAGGGNAPSVGGVCAKADPLSISPTKMCLSDGAVSMTATSHADKGNCDARPGWFDLGVNDESRLFVRPHASA